MKKTILFKPTVLQLLVIFSVSILLLLPQLFGRGLILGSDVVFHFNRFYETSQQIKEGNYQYFLSIYGFQQSGRIVNALYGPFFAYFQGILVLISHSWFQYQLLSNGLLYLLAGTSMYTLLRKLNVSGWLSVGMGILFMTTYSIQYWVERQGFSAWGAAILPFCLIPLIDMTRFQRIRPFAVGVSVAALFQIHVFSSVLLVLIYIPFFLSTFLKSQEKKQLLLHLAAAIGIFLLLTANIWLAMLDLYRSNQLLPPFVNHNMEQNTITGTSSYWWTSPYLFPLLCGVFFAGALMKWRQLSKGLKMLTVVAGIFFLLSSNYLPWQWLASLENPLIELIQFPFRFFVPATVLILAGLCLLRPYVADSRLNRPIWLILLLIVSVGQIMFQTSTKMSEWQSSDSAVKVRNHSYLFTSDQQTLKEAYFSQDKAKALVLFQRSTPDYVPIYRETKENKYNAYGEQIIEKNKTVQKAVVNGQLILRWQGDDSGWKALPVINYQRTTLQLNGQPLKPSDIKLSTIGAVSVKQQTGLNELIVDYDAPWYFDWGLWVTMAAWLLLALGFLWKKRQLFSILRGPKNQKK
ncbi:hypothetical protein [Enterococcus sp.]|uniref:hypothetical protein n=1 Tax=Enterococcus sp. TaxID=35783 RepID=UPI0025BCAACF|nr:hypothetical protein [Enterococcus sp.]